MKFRTKLSLFVATLLLAVSAAAAELTVGTLNTYLHFSPAYKHRGRLEGQAALTAGEYATKTANLAAMISRFDVVGLQEIGGRPEVEDLAKLLGFDSAFVGGKDTYTGQEVGVIWRRLPGWRVTNNGRVPSLDASLSKHILVTLEAPDGQTRIRLLNVHMIRPIGENATKHAAQIDAINTWAAGVLAGDKAATVVVVGDTNNETRGPIFTFGQEANALNKFAGTHNVGKPFDRLAVGGRGRWTKVDVVAPPYGTKRPDNFVLRMSTDHRAVGAVLSTP
jgi:endonuclease/exonuclease/phosphatase family metal-dependent hydrolase